MEPRGPDSSVRIALRDGEVMTSLVPASGPAGSSWLLASTSRGRLVKVYKTSRPLALHAKFVPRQEARGDGRRGTGGGGGPRQGTVPVPDHPVEAVAGRSATPSPNEGAGDGEDIAAVLPVPTGSRTPSGRSPPPRKMARIAPGENSAGSIAKIAPQWWGLTPASARSGGSYADVQRTAARSDTPRIQGEEEARDGRLLERRRRSPDAPTIGDVLCVNLLKLLAALTASYLKTWPMIW
ncbi:hypothetical protein THAOC_05825 [Thalassiosira oceanica]|uniref:Uncharacterized protein n=1 Tax=Thalassiosira oceanica TaxID=159749 RepID=K0TME2_THAOC|nr:hypothetical protein THAOC_05825 [Thalassiosira oceanica]|eukprot:EJK72627.1 hypothetical protein THAOC_05825 [Thalassiosira oceanica]